MEYTMHDVIKWMLAGKTPTAAVWFEENEDLKTYESFIPALCGLLRTKRGQFDLFDPGVILMHIIPDEPEPFVFEKLIEQLPGNREHGIGILKILAKYQIHEQVDISPILDLIGDDYFSSTAILALRKTYHPEAEQKILPLLRNELRGDLELLKIYSDTLAVNGSILSLPVLMAVSQDFTDPGARQHFTSAVKAICNRLQMPDDIRLQLEDPKFWKFKWGGSPEHFAGFIEFLSMFMISGGADDGKKEDMIAEIFMQEMEVDLSPYQSFEAARLCTSPDIMLSGLTNLKESLECNLLLEAITEGTEIMPSSYTMAKDLYFDLMNDYLMTRLRRHISFAPDQS